MGMKKKKAFIFSMHEKKSLLQNADITHFINS